MSSNNNPTLAIACGPIVSTWDVSKTNIESNNNDTLDDEYYSSTSYDINTIIDATSLLSHSHSHFASSAAPCSSSSLSSSQSHLESIGVGQFKPFSYDAGHLDVDGSIVNDIAWNHNGQGETKETSALSKLRGISIL